MSRELVFSLEGLQEKRRETRSGLMCEWGASQGESGKEHRSSPTISFVGASDGITCQGAVSGMAEPPQNGEREARAPGPGPPAVRARDPEQTSRALDLLPHLCHTILKLYMTRPGKLQSTL